MRDTNCGVGLIEHLVVFDQGECYEILDGHLRYALLLEMGMEIVPCSVEQPPPISQEELS